MASAGSSSWASASARCCRSRRDDAGVSSSGRRRVMLLFGGRSAEHDVSRVTAVAVAKAPDPERYEIVPVGITTDGRWLAGGEATAVMASGPAALPGAFPVDGEELSSLGELVA